MSETLQWAVLALLALAVLGLLVVTRRHTKALMVVTDLILTHSSVLRDAQNLDVSPVGPPVFCGQKTGERTWCAMDLTDGVCPRHGRRA